MLLSIILFITLLLYSIILSQPLFYWMAMARASRSLSGPAYVEMRQMIDREMESRGRLFYYLCLASCTLLAVLLLWMPFTALLPATLLAWAMLLADILISLGKNVPINRIINTWDRNRLPDNWAQYRQTWLSIYSIRQWLLLAGFAGLLLGVLSCI